MISPLPIGHVLNDLYEILTILGEGDFGIVYQARDLRATKTHPLLTGTTVVALKQMPMQMIVDCERQADLRAALLHPAVPRILGYFVVAEYAYLVHEFIDGWNLEAVLSAQTGHLAQKSIVSWAIQLCDALHYLHTHPYHPIVFRDIKPNNIMVTPGGHVYLVDFGLARAYPPRFFEEDQPQFAHLWRGLDMGTAGYSPPEQYEGYVTPRSDIYALGATLHHLLTRRDPRTQPPFTFDIIPMRALNPHISPDLEKIILKALQRDLDRRFASALEMKQALESLL